VASIDGLASGLDTTTIITQLMAIERQPQTRLSTQRLAALAKATTWTQTGAALKALQTAAQGLSKTASLARTSAISSNPAVGVTSTATAAPGTHTLTVTSLAAARTVGSAGMASSTAPVGAGALVLGRGLAALGVTGFGVTGTDGAASGTYTLEVTAVDPANARASVTVNGTSHEVDTSSGVVEVAGLQLDATDLQLGKAEITVARTTAPGATASDLAGQLNGAAGIASASLVMVSPGDTRLLLQSSEAGTAGALQVGRTEGLSALGTFSDVRPAADARLQLDGLDITRSSNTVTDLLPGVTLTLTAPASDLTVTVSSDPAASATVVKDLVTKLNAVLTGLSTATAYDATTKKGGALLGDGGARGLINALRDTVGRAATGAAGTLGGIGLGLQRDGTYAFDETAFAAGLAKDPAAAADLVARIGTALTTTAKNALDSHGAVAAGKDAADTTARNLQTQVDAYEQRLTLTQARLTRQFNALETAMSSLQSQGSALTGQINSLPSWSTD